MTFSGFRSKKGSTQPSVALWKWRTLHCSNLVSCPTPVLPIQSSELSVLPGSWRCSPGCRRRDPRENVQATPGGEGREGWRWGAARYWGQLSVSQQQLIITWSYTCKGLDVPYVYLAWLWCTIKVGISNSPRELFSVECHDPVLGDFGEKNRPSWCREGRDDRKLECHGPRTPFYIYIFLISMNI